MPTKQLITDSSEILKAVVGAKEVTVAIPPNETLDAAVSKLKSLSSAFNVIDAARNSLTGIIGKILREIQVRKLYRTRYKTFGEFLSSEVYDGVIKLGKTTVSNALKIAKTFPSLSDMEYQSLGATKLLEACKFTSEIKDPKGFRDVLKAFNDAPTVADATQWALNNNLAPTRRTPGVTWTCRIAPDSRETIDAYFNNPEVQKWAGDVNHEVILLKTLQYTLDRAVNKSEPPLFTKPAKGGRHHAA